MTRKYWALLAVALVLGALSLYFNTDWFRSQRIQILHRSAPSALFRRKRPGNPVTAPVMFEFNRKLKLTDIKVVSVSELATNKYPQLFWHLVSDSNSVPTRGFAYGISVPGMRPATKGIEPYPLEPGVKYRLLLEAGSTKADHDFVPQAAPR